MTTPAIAELRALCNKEITNINLGAGVNTPGFAAINRLLKACDKVFADVPAEPPTYHDVHVTTPTIERTSIFNLPYRVILQCTRAGGWGLWGRAEEFFGEVYYEENLGEHGLRIDVAGHVIYDTLTPRK